MNKSLSLLIVLALGAPVAWSQAAHDHDHAAPAQASPDTLPNEGEVRKVDKDNRKITLKHGEIKDLDMPPMTMVFQVTDAAMLDKVRPGDKVRFKASNDGGKLTVTAMEPAR